MLRSWTPWYWKTNANEVLGFKPGELVCIDGKGGGGFANEPIHLEVIPRSALVILEGDDPEPVPYQFPQPGRGCQYHIGGRLWGAYNRYNGELAEHIKRMSS